MSDILLEADTVASMLQQMLDLGRDGDKRTRGQVISYINDLKHNPITREAPEIRRLPRGPEMFDVKTAKPRTAPRVRPSPMPAAPPVAPAPVASAAPAPSPAVNPPVPPPTPVAPPAAAPAPIPAPARPAAPTPVVPPPVQPRIRDIATIMQQDGVSQSKADKIQQQEILARARPVTPEDQAARRAGVTSSSPSLRAAPPPDPEKQVIAQIGPLLRAPQTDPRKVLQAISAALQRTQPGTAKRQKLVDLIKSLQANPQAIAKVPQLKQIAVESRLYEATGGPEEPLSRSELDAIFHHVARELIASGRLEGGGGGGNDAKTTTPGQPQGGGLDPYMHSIITKPHFDAAVKHLRPNRKQAEIISAFLATQPKKQTIREFLRAFQAAPANRHLQLRDFDPTIIATLIQAAHD